MQPTSTRFPWYDSVWLSTFVDAQRVIQEACPHRLDEFVHAFDVLKTRSDFQVRFLPQVFNEAVMDQIQTAVRALKMTDFGMHELELFGRFVIHDLPLFQELQRQTLPLVNEIVGEEVEPSYNFLSMYTKHGVCAVHMDAPKAKWTLDYCIDQTVEWPIQFSEVRPWPVHYQLGEKWEEQVRSDASPFTAYSLEPGEAVIFSGSSQWHYRDPIPDDGQKHYCHLAFFHFVPKGTRALVNPESWPALFNVPELAAIL
jgi:hypothetical protein